MPREEVKLSWSHGYQRTLLENVLLCALNGSGTTVARTSCVPLLGNPEPVLNLKRFSLAMGSFHRNRSSPLLSSPLLSLLVLLMSFVSVPFHAALQAG